MRTALVLACLMLGMAMPAFAQDTRPAVEISGGYSFLRDQDIEENLHGWLASVSGNVTRWLGIVGEVGGNYKTVTLFDTDFDFSVHSFMAGARFSARGPGNVTPFGQVLVGAARGSISVLDESESSTEFAVQGGGGVDFWVRPRLAIRVGGDYRRIVVNEDDDGGLNEFRFYAGLVVGAGTR